ncbi:hypothetical protein SCP_1003520 [Sparassis crispa]|uniref:Uncharacterized protein n=1 Tax=Sparassis crispa TaxID=139825 RepID=A0A401GY03_9APHY|nr:hypothetical protein SCP_1003520 [Sparassis crispa]GBE87105.1 hypothetical protein SCP_1003520 [Sparassis crispa]
MVAVASCGPCIYITLLKPESLLLRSWVSCSCLRIQLSLGGTVSSLSRTQLYRHYLCTSTNTCALCGLLHLLLFSTIIVSSCQLPYIVGFAIALGRLYAAFNCDRRFLIIVGTYFGLQLAWMLALYAVFAANFQVIELPQTWTGCMPSRPGAYEWMMWIPAVSTEGALLAILLIKGTQIVHQGIRPPRALFVILRDTLLYLALIIGLILVSTPWTEGLETISATFPPMWVALVSTSGCRMLLNIHQVMESNRSPHSINSITIHLSSLQFASSESVHDAQ